MAKHMTLVTLIGLLSFNCFADFSSLREIADVYSQFKTVNIQLDSVYNKGQILGDKVALDRLNMAATEVLNNCQKIENKFLEKAPEILTRRQESKNRAIELSESLLNSTDPELRKSQVQLIRNFETSKYCLVLTNQLHTAIRASTSGGI